MKKTLLFILTLMGLVLLGPFRVESQIIDAHTIIANPGEDASTEMNISWHMDQRLGQGRVEYRVKTDEPWANAVVKNAVCKATSVYDDKKSKSPSGADIIENPNIQHCTVELKDLEVDTVYQYRVGSSNMSTIRTFKTAGAEEFSFVWISDFHAYTPIPSRLNAAMNMIDTAISKDPDVDFVFHTGDVVAWGGSHSFWKDLYSRPIFERYMWAGVNGNHDNMDSTDSQNTYNYIKHANNFPKNGYGNQEGVCYYFMYNNVLFIILNNEVLGTNTSNLAVLEAQAWAAQVIENNPSQYIFVASHYEWFSGVTGASRDFGYSRWKNFFDRYQVDLAMSGNNHIYTRTHRLYQDQVSTNDQLGTVYMTAPSSDNERGSAMNDNLTYNSDKIAYRFSEGGPTVGAILVNVNGKEVTTKLLNRHGEVLDTTSFRAKKEAYPMETFDKQSFEKSFVYSSSKFSSATGIISHSPLGFGYIQKIEYFDEVGNSLGVNQFSKRSQSFAVFNSLHPKTTFKIIITYKDHSISQVTLYQKNLTEVSNVRLVIVDGKSLLRWDKPLLGNEEIAIFQNNVYLGMVMASKESFILNSLRATDDVEIRSGKESVGCFYQTRYLLYGDVSLDGFIDEEDVVRVMNAAIGNAGLLDATHLGDVDQDGILSIIDATYIHLAMKNKDINLNKKTFTVRYFSHSGQFMHQEEVEAKKDACYSDFTVEEGYTFVGWSQMVNSVSLDMNVYMIVERALDLRSSPTNKEVR